MKLWSTQFQLSKNKKIVGWTFPHNTSFPSVSDHCGSLQHLLAYSRMKGRDQGEAGIRGNTIQDNFWNYWKDEELQNNFQIIWILKSKKKKVCARVLSFERDINRSFRASASEMFNKI